MKISTKGRYALRMLLDLAQNRDMGFIPLKDIAARQDISKKYLEQIVGLLNQSNVLRTNRGYQGGYQLARPASDYTVGEILRITEGSISSVSCLEAGENNCARREECMTLPLWQGLDRVIAEYLDSFTLQDLIDNYERTTSNGGCDFCI